jgi:hypothetical protein
VRIGLIDVDGHKGHPNLALMRLSAYHKNQGHTVDWWNGFEHYDRVYMSKVFTFTPDFDTVINADEIIRGGTGYKDYGSLPPEIEATYPDYSIYPNYKAAIGFLTRGCIRNCPWCIVPRKEGYIHPAATWQEIKRPDSREIVFLDNNVLASDHGLQQIEEMGSEKIWVDFNQGLDARLIDKDVAQLLAHLHWIRFVRVSCDAEAMLPVVINAAQRMVNAGISRSRLWSYVLVQDIKTAHKICVTLDDWGITPFAQPYRDFDGGEPTEEQKDFARWVNNKAVFHSCAWQDYSRRRK